MPLFSILTPVYNTPKHLLRRCAKSVLRQNLADWEWCLVDDGSSDVETLSVLSEIVARDPRIRLEVRAANGGIVAASSDALAMASGDFIALLDHDDELEPDALQRMAEVIHDVPDVDFIYSDELVWGSAIGRYFRLFKPAWSPERLRCQMYTNHLTVYRREIVDRVGGFRPGYDGAQDHDLALRVAEVARSVRHVPYALYRWNEAPGSTVGDASAKPWAFEAGVRAVQDHCRRIELPTVCVEAGASPGIVRIKRAVTDDPLVSIVIPSRGPIVRVRGERRSLLESIIRDLLERTDYANIEILIVPDTDTPSMTLDECVRMDPARVAVVPPVPPPFNFSVKVNIGAAYARGDYLLFLNDDIEVIDRDWLGAMVAIAQQPDVGAVGALLLFEDETIQHAGVFLSGGPGHVGFRDDSSGIGFMGQYAVDRECIAVTGACLLMPTSVFNEVGAFTLGLPSNWGDVDLCLKVIQSGRRVIWTPQARLYHYESVSRDPTERSQDVLQLWGRWAHMIMNDPYFTPVLGPHSRSWPRVPHR